MQALSNIAGCYLETGRRTEGLVAVDEYVGVVRTQHAERPLQLASGLIEISGELIQGKEYSKAESLLREGLAIRERFQRDAWNTFTSASMLGGALLGQKKYTDAEPLLLKGFEGLKHREKSIPPQGKTRIPEAVDRLIELYTATNKPDEVKKWKAERAKYPAANATTPPKSPSKTAVPKAATDGKAPTEGKSSQPSPPPSGSGK
jgi:hypothetical protein